MRAQDAVGLGVCQHLHKPVGIVDRAGAPVGLKEEFAGLILDAFFVQLGGRFADACDLRIGINDVGDRVIKYMRAHAVHALDADNTLVFGEVGEHRAGDDVADGVDAFDRGFVVAVDLDKAARVGLQADIFQAEPVGIRPAPDRHHQLAALKRLGRALFAVARLIGHRDRLAVDLRAGDFRVHDEVKPLLGEDILGLLHDFGVRASAQDLGQILDDRDLGTQARPYRAQLQADDTRANDDEMLGDFGELQRPGRVDYGLFIVLDARNRRRLGAGGDENLFGLKRLRLAVFLGDDDCIFVMNRRGAVDPVDLILAEEKLDAAGQAVDDLAFAGEHLPKIELNAAHVDAVLGQLAVGVVEFMARLEQGL